jgi:dsDNA-specific endonuclease/ATPase MutS2
MAMPEPKRVSLDQVKEFVNQLSPDDQEQLFRTLGDKVRHMYINIDLPKHLPKDKEMDEIRKSAQEALKKSGVTVNELLAEIEKVREENFARDYPDLANAS